MDILETILLLLSLLLDIQSKKCPTSNKRIYPQTFITLNEIITIYSHIALQGLSGGFKEQYLILSLKSLRLVK